MHECEGCSAPLGTLHTCDYCQRPRYGMWPTGRESPHYSAGEYVVSAERVRAAKEAGLWDDPRTRNMMLAAYKKYDTEQGVL